MQCEQYVEFLNVKPGVLNVKPGVLNVKPGVLNVKPGGSEIIARY